MKWLERWRSNVTGAGDPRAVAPELFARLTRHEQSHSVRSYRIHQATSSKASGELSDGDPRLLARNAMYWGVRNAGWVVTVSIVMPLCALTGLCFARVSPASMAIAVGLLSLIVWRLVAWKRREREVDRWLKELWPESTH